MKRSHSVDDGNAPTAPIKYDGDSRLSGDFDKVPQHDMEKRRNEKFMNDKNGRVFEFLENNNRMEQMEIENYSLRKRCIRLESIVTQLLENKGKSENDEEQVPSSDNHQSEDIRVTVRPYQEEIHPYERPYTHESPSPPYHNSLPKRTSPTRTIPPPPPPPFSHENLIYEQRKYSKFLPTSALLSDSSQAFLAHRPMSHVHIPASLKVEEDEGEPKKEYEDLEISDPRHMPRKTPTPPNMFSKAVEKVEKKEQDKGIVSPAEMEERNELFRSTYYVQRTFEKKTTDSIIFNERQHSPPHRRRAFLDTYRIPDRTSPELFLPMYQRRYHPYDLLKIDLERKERDENYRPELRRIESSRRDLLRDDPRSYYEPLSSHKVSTMQNVHASELRDMKRISPPMKVRHSIPNMHQVHRKRNHIESYSSRLPRPMPQLISSDPNFNKYNSDFYTKLPPKLHIVESQNENGVTLTWNATSNCDSSLVKSYQLFARELFGHKVGTMKRIGIVDALPLPMSCNIDRLKYNIKYKFAVCAVDIYGRFGKMSNFTGKFELKPKGIVSEHDDRELRIII